MTISRFAVFILICILVQSTQAQDSLLLTNGKIKNLKGVVVYTDHDDILYQNDIQRKQMKAYVSRIQSKQNKPAYIKKQEKERIKSQERENAKQAKDQQKLAQLKADFETDVARNLERLSPADFEKWKNRELDKIKTIETKKELNDALDNQIVASRQNKKEAKERAKFTKRFARDLVFSVLKADSTEIIVYNADTLGYFADGDAEVDYGITEMRAYMKGQQAGRKHKTTFDLLMGVGIGAISSGAGAYWGPSIPAGYIIVTSIANTKIKNKAGVEPSLLENQAFLDGYEKAAKRKKTWSFVKGSIAGLGFGILMWDGIVRGEGLPGPR